MFGYGEMTRLASAKKGSFTGEIYADEDGAILLRLTPGTMLSATRLEMHLDSDRLTMLELAVHTANVSLYETSGSDVALEDYEKLRPVAQKQLEQLVGFLHDVESGTLK